MHDGNYNDFQYAACKVSHLTCIIYYDQDPLRECLTTTNYNISNGLSGVGFSSDAALRFAGLSQDF